MDIISWYWPGTIVLRMLDICTDYVSKRRFQFNGMKSCVVQFSKSSVILIGQELIPVADSHIHLGTELNRKLSTHSRTTNTCRNGRNTYFPITNIRDNNTNPLVLVKLYKSVVIPSFSYGCEIQHHLKNIDLLLLNRLQHFAVSSVQKFSTLTRSDMCESMVGLRSMICIIEKSKLFFLGKLCKIYNGYLVNNIFIHRLSMSEN